MNRSAINTATINSVVPDVVQRTVLVSRAYAVVNSRITILSRGPVSCVSRADITAACHVVQRSVVACRASAVIDCTGAERRRTPVVCYGSADIDSVGTQYPRQSYSQSVLAAASAQILARGRGLLRSPVTATQEARATIRTDAIYYVHMSQVAATGRAVITVDGEVIKKIPFNGLAPSDRTMDWAGDSREMTWL